MTSRSFLWMGLILLVSACKKDEADQNKPTIHWNRAISPTYTNGSTVHVDVTITEDTELHDILIEARDITNDSLYIHVMDHAHSISESYHETFAVHIPQGTTADFEVKVEAEDHAGNKATEKKTFRASH